MDRGVQISVKPKNRASMFNLKPQKTSINIPQKTSINKPKPSL